MKRYEVEKSKNGLYVVRDKFRGNLLNEEYEKKETAEKVADLFENISIVKGCENEWNKN